MRNQHDAVFALQALIALEATAKQLEANPPHFYPRVSATLKFKPPSAFDPFSHIKMGAIVEGKLADAANCTIKGSMLTDATVGHVCKLTHAFKDSDGYRINAGGDYVTVAVEMAASESKHAKQESTAVDKNLNKSSINNELTVVVDHHNKSWIKEVAVADHGDGEYSVSWIPTSSGSAILHVEVYGELISQCPMMIQVFK